MLYFVLQTSENGKAIGYLYEFDCKPVVTEANLPGEWSAVAFEHQVNIEQDSSFLKSIQFYYYYIFNIIKRSGKTSIPREQPNQNKEMKTADSV